MKKYRRMELVVKGVYVGLLTIFICCAVIAEDNGNLEAEAKDDVGKIEVCVTPVPTVTPISTPKPTPTPIPELTPTPEITEVPEKEIEDMSVKEPTLYSTYSEEELELLFRVVEAEATDADIECKSHVASVIFNRLKEGWWDGDLTRTLMAKNQFEVVTNGRYKKVTITEETIIACELAFKEDTARGALFFDSTDGKSWAARNLTWIFCDKAGHDFYY